MSLDGIAMRALAQDLKTKLSGGRIDKISQPSATTMTMGVRAGGHNHKCYATINPQSARVSLSRKSFESPQTPPQFCMVLRKHIQGAVIENIRQVDWERMIAFDLRGGTNNYRQFQPGIPYQMPPAQNKRALDTLDEASLAEALLEQGLSKTASKALLSAIAGLGPQTVTELLVRANIAPDTRVEFLGEIDYHRLWQQCSGLIARCADADWQPTLVYRGREIFAFAPFALEQFAAFHQETRPDMTTMLEDFYEIKEEQELFSQKRTSLERIVRHEKERCEKKLALQLEKVDELEHADSWRIKGELLTANLYRIKQGPSAEVENFYKDGAPLETIEMNPSKTPNENAQGYFKKYNKAKISAEKAALQAERTSEELEYLRTIEDSLDQAQTTDDLTDVRLELEEAGYAKRHAQPRGKKAQHKPQPTHLFIDGYELYIGKNNHQNDYVTQKIGRNADLWLHTKDIHGAHVIIKAHRSYDGFSPDIIEKAAELAAWFSKARYSAKVPVDVTLRKNVHKPSGAKPGMVIYTDQQTVYVTPEEATIDALLAQTEASE